MQRRTHASIGAWTLASQPPAQAWGDAFRSIELVGSSTLAGIETSAAAPDEQPPALEHPIEAARAWLNDPARGEALPKRLRERAEETLTVAEAHLRELDLIAGELAREANESGELDPVRLARIDGMASVMRRYAQRMRELLDPESVEPERVERTLDTALDAARGGGLPALVAAL